MKAAAASLLGCALIAFAWSGWRSAAREATAAANSLAAAQSLVAEVTQLRARASTAFVGARPQPGIVTQLSASLIETGIPVDALRSLSPDSDIGTTRIGERDFKRQSARVTLEPLTLPQFGRFSASWCAAQPEWTVSAIQITPTADLSEHGDRPLRIDFTIEALYVDELMSPTP